VFGLNKCARQNSQNFTGSAADEHNDGESKVTVDEPAQNGF